ncbi:glycosyltransferase family 2 protein [Salinicola avicenniae]|uniref:glycosyltransferase family 2 protein n=1 Tax=Salinicola avicenniae TaxID=2916836 RepID=UPI0020732929|nr:MULTISPECIES: glycosyltransferase family 2 protein [unclassified Salinicola]
MIARVAQPPHYRFAIAAIVKNERPYLAEWITHHRLIGIEHFYIADNGSDDGTAELLADWQAQGWLTTQRWVPGDRAQTSWYRHVLTHEARNVDYLLFLDADEFLVDVDGDQPLARLLPLLERPEVGAVAINWRIFGSGGLRFRQPGGVLSRFRRASVSSHSVNCHVKSIVKPRCATSVTAHTATLLPGFQYLTANGQQAAFLEDKPGTGRTRTVVETPCRVYHYNIKSLEEYVDTKMPRGRANMAAGHTRDLTYFRNHDLNDTEVTLSSAWLKCVADTSRLLEPASAEPAPTRFFVHIPKTAGTSFRLGAKRHLGESGVWHDYGEKQRETAADVVRWVYERRDFWRLWQMLAQQNVALLGGHVPLEKYAHLAGLRNCFSFVRDPFQRVASDYHHFVRHHGFQGSFSDFYRRDDMINRQSRFLDSTSLEAIGFVGLTERYSESLSLINDLYGWAVPGLVENLGHTTVDHRYEIAPEDEAALRELNRKDLHLYAACRALFESRLALWREGKAYVHGGIQQCQPDRVVGWAWWATDDTPVEMEIWVNGERVGQTLANALRPGFLRWGAPRGSYVGFHLPLKSSPGDVVDCRVMVTGQSLGPRSVRQPERLRTSLEPERK